MYIQVQLELFFYKKNRCLPPFDVKSMSHLIQFHPETLNTISIWNSSNFMQTISSYLVKISVNVVYNCTIITWYKIAIDNRFCDGQSSKGNNSKSINDRVTILALCTLTHVGWYLYKVSWIKLKQFSSYRADTVFAMDKVPRKITQKV